ncbi:MAG: hypothetical protein ACK5SI_01085 [Planctomycetia bacterium]|jgi:hypothetical protein
MGNKRVDNTMASQLPMFILDVLQHDVAEQVSSILRLLNNDGCIGWREFWPRDFSEEEVVEALGRLVEEGRVIVFRESAENGELVPTSVRELPMDVNSQWYGRSMSGEEAWDSWEPPTSEGR